jgi:peptidyl-prolyl cis-trans isomerase D
MVLITVLVIVSFTYFGPGMRQGTGGQMVVMHLYDQDITREDLQRQGRRVGIFAALRGEYIQALDPSVAFGMREAGTETVARSFVLEHEMNQLGLSATSQERLDALTKLPAFADQEGNFDPEKFNLFKTRVLNPQGFSDTDLDQIFLAGEVRVRKLQEIVGSLAAPTPSEVREQIIRQKQKTEASYIAFRRDDFRKDVKVTEEDLKKRYEEQKELFKTPEERKVRYAAFLLPTPADGKPLEGKERTTQLQKLADTAYAFAQELQEQKGANFAELAKKHNATVGETKDFFTAATVPNELEGSDKIGAAAFELTKEKPHSPHISLQKGSYVLELLDIKAPEVRKFEDVRKELEEQVTSAKADELARAKANEVRPKLEELIKGGKSFADAAKELGLTAQAHPAFGGGQRPPAGEFDAVIVPAAGKLAPGQLSEVLMAPGNNAALIVHVDYRSAVDDKEIADARAATLQRIQSGARFMVFPNWLVERSRAAGLDKFFSRGSGS